MKLHTRAKAIVAILNKTDKPLSARQITDLYIKDEEGSSHVLSTGSILNMLATFGFLKKHITFKGKSVRHKYSRIGNNLLPEAKDV